MKRNLFLLSLLILLIGCKEKQNTAEVAIADFNINGENYKSFEESNYQLSYEIIPLEFTDNSMISSIQNVIMNDRYIYMIANKRSLLLFDKQGKYVNTIEKGRAANKLMFPMCLTIDEKNGNIEVLDNANKIKIYDPTGNYISSKELETPIREFGKSADRYIEYGSIDRNATMNFKIIDGNQVNYYSEKCGANAQFQLPAFNLSRITKYNKDLYFIACYDNILYKMGEKDKEPVELIKFNNAFADITMKNGTMDEVFEKCGDKKFASIGSLMTLSEDLFYMIGLGVQGKYSYSLLYDKSTGFPYKYPFPLSIYSSYPINAYNGKTIHSFNSVHFPDLKEEDFNPEVKELYAMIKERHEKYGTEENPYLILVSYNKKK